MNECVIKFGKTSVGVSSRMRGYPKGSQMVWCLAVMPGVDVEDRILRAASREFKPRLDLGNEYFEGPITKMLSMAQREAGPFALTTDVLCLDRSNLTGTTGNDDGGVVGQEDSDKMAQEIETTEDEPTDGESENQPVGAGAPNGEGTARNQQHEAPVIAKSAHDPLKLMYAFVDAHRPLLNKATIPLFQFCDMCTQWIQQLGEESSGEQWWTTNRIKANLKECVAVHFKTANNAEPPLIVFPSLLEDRTRAAVTVT